MPLKELTPKAEEFAAQPPPEQLLWSIDQLDPQDAMAVVLGMHWVLRQDVLKKSECNHRTVAATVFSQLPEKISAQQAQKEFESSQITGAVVNIKDRNYLYVIDVNRWTDSVEPRLDCKDQGIPWNMGLTALSSREEITQRSEIDLLCPKRQQDKVCRIEHAEPLALKGFTHLAKRLEIEQLENCFIICNWVNCPSCLDLLKEESELFNNSRVISLFGALEDQEDLSSIAETKRFFEQENLGHLHGPYMWISKDDGYGWMPAETDIIENYFKDSSRPVFRPTKEEDELRGVAKIAFQLAINKDIFWTVQEEFNLYH
jgi:hypothetical protein